MTGVSFAELWIQQYKSHQMLAIRTCAGPGFTRSCGSSLIVSAGDVKHPPELQASLIESLATYLTNYLTLWGGNMPAWAYIGELQSSIEKCPPESGRYSKGSEIIIFPCSERHYIYNTGSPQELFLSWGPRPCQSILRRCKRPAT